MHHLSEYLEVLSPPRIHPSTLWIVALILRPNLEEFSSSGSASQAVEVGVAVCNFQGIFEVVSKNCILGRLFQTIVCPCLGMMQSDACICSIDFYDPTIRFRSLSGSKTSRCPFENRSNSAVSPPKKNMGRLWNFGGRCC